MSTQTKHLWPVMLGALLVMLLPETLCASGPYKIGVLARRGKDTCMLEWQETARHLTKKIKGCSFEIVPLDFHEIQKAVEQKEVDFVICNPAVYIDLAASFDCVHIATLKRLHEGAAFAVFSAAIFTRADAAGISSLADIRKKSFMAVEQNSFGGWLMALREFKEAGINPSVDCMRLEFCGSHDAVVYAVRDGRADAGTVSSGTLESMASEGKISLREFKILNRDKYPDSSFPYEHSTRLYPEWPFLKLAHTPDDIAEKVTVVLLEMPPDSPAAKTAGCAGWTYTVSYKNVLECLEKVRYGPYKDWGEIRLHELLKHYGKSIAAVLAATTVLLVFTLYILVLNRRLRRSNSRSQCDHGASAGVTAAGRAAS
jgi:ABC-type phosphate/phosphonate transport system substrate-binding protein